MSNLPVRDPNKAAVTVILPAYSSDQFCKVPVTYKCRCLVGTFVPQLKHGEIHSTVHAAAVLTGTEYALEVQMSAYSLLQYLVSS